MSATTECDGSFFEVEIESAIEPSSFARILATVVNGSPVHLSKVVVSGAVVYPCSSGSILNPPSMCHCRFDVRNASESLTEMDVAGLMERIASRFGLGTVRIIRPAVLAAA